MYSRAPVVLLDDVFSALDHRTSLNVFSRLLGDEGILRRKHTTVLLATHTGKCFPNYSINNIRLRIWPFLIELTVSSGILALRRRHHRAG